MNLDLVLELASPTMIGGAEARQCDDPPRLRPPSLRGALRFWARALGGPRLEGELFGDTELGQRTQILFARGDGDGGNLPPPEEALLIPSRNATAPMVPPGSRVHVRFRVPEPVELPKLQAVIWTWLHLGSIGRRSRRGYGSPLWIPSEDDLLDGWPPLWTPEHLESKDSLEKYLTSGLQKVEAELGAPGKDPRASTDTQLATRDQVFVGERIDAEWNIRSGTRDLEDLLHGRNERDRGDAREADQLGRATNPRLPSPMMWRVYPAPEGGYLPVMTWFPHNYPTGEYPEVPTNSALSEYLNKFGFQDSLIGQALYG